MWQAPGAGAAGGVGFAALAVLGAERRPGIELVLDLVDFDAALEGTSLVITGEGALDTQTLAGKAPAGEPDPERSTADASLLLCRVGQALARDRLVTAATGA